MNSNSYLHPPGHETKVLVHACCAVCACSIIEALLENGIMPTIHFCNDNIYPQKEYEIRKNEIIRYTRKLGITFIEEDYEPERWSKAVEGHEKDPERGERCGLCFKMRLTKTAEYAKQKGFKLFTSSLGISRWKDFDQVTEAGRAVASLYPGVSYWEQNWRKNGGSEKMARISKHEDFYRQKYCGCKLSQGYAFNH